MLSDDDIMTQVLAVFQEEQLEHRQMIGEILLELERQPQHAQQTALLDQLFREAHSLKGGARAAGQPAVEKLAHHIEDIFSGLRQGVIELTPEVCDIVYATLDAVGALMQQVAVDQPPDLEPYKPLLARLSQLVPGTPPDLEQLDTALAYPESDGHAASRDQLSSANRLSSPPDTTTVRLSTTILDTLLSEASELTTCNLRSQQRSREVALLAKHIRRWQRTWSHLRPAYGTLRSRLALHQRQLPQIGAHAPRPTHRPESLGREGPQLLDALAQANELIEELQSRLEQQSRLAAEDSARLAAVTERLQGQIRRTRMLPLATLFSQIRLQTREMARMLGKQVELELDDGDAEADRQILERLREVLLHLLRNALDHGIEPTDVRLARGKPASGKLSLQTVVSGDRLLLTVEDDGAGLELEAIRRQALNAGLVSEADLAHMAQTELMALIFQPGFSTRQTISALSGRGIGLDIVRSHIERMHGRVTVDSTPGAGCRFTISVPLSLVTSQGLLLRAGGSRYALPLDAIKRIIEVTPQATRMVQGRPTLPIDGRPVPLLSLAGVLSGTVPSWQGKQQTLLIGSSDRPVGYLVEAVEGEQELVIHRLPYPLKQVRYVAGATILPDGSVVPILDVVDLLRAAVQPGNDLSLRPELKLPVPRPRPTVLVVDDSITTRTLEKNILEAAGYRVLLAADGLEALNLLSTMSKDDACSLLLSDVDMPRMDGFELTARVRSDPKLKHLPVVLVTSLDRPVDRQRGVTAGADAYITKQQFEQYGLLETIAQLI